MTDTQPELIPPTPAERIASLRAEAARQRRLAHDLRHAIAEMLDAAGRAERLAAEAVAEATRLEADELLKPAPEAAT